VKTELEKRREIYTVGEAAVRYYVETGLCVFCMADDCNKVSHDNWCPVRGMSEVVEGKERRVELASNRAAMAQVMKEKGQ